MIQNAEEEWQKEALISWQEGQKQHLQKQNFLVGNTVLLRVDAHQNNWPMDMIVCVCPDKNDVA